MRTSETRNLSESYSCPARSASQSNLGLSQTTFATVGQRVDVVVNCAANRAFWDSYETLKSVNVSAVHDIARLAPTNKATFHQLSSDSANLATARLPRALAGWTDT